MTERKNRGEEQRSHREHGGGTKVVAWLKAWLSEGRGLGELEAWAKAPAQPSTLHRSVLRVLEHAEATEEERRVAIGALVGTRPGKRQPRRQKGGMNFRKYGPCELCQSPEGILMAWGKHPEPVHEHFVCRPCLPKAEERWA